MAKVDKDKVIEELNKKIDILQAENYKLKDIFQDIILLIKYHNTSDDADNNIVINKDKFIEYINIEIENAKNFKKYL